ncbi:unnamed protein product, partial [marine sediment metagenome]
MGKKRRRRVNKDEAIGKVVSLLPSFSAEFLSRLADRLAELKRHPPRGPHLRLFQSP